MKAFFTNKNIWKRMLVTLLVLMVYEVGIHITLPYIDTDALTQGLSTMMWANMVAMVGGAGLDDFSIFALGVTPYITSSIVIQLLSFDIVPKLSKLAKEGEKGRQKLDDYTKYMAVIFAVIQSVSLMYSLYNNKEDIFLGGLTTEKVIFNAIVLTAGSLALVWLADRITRKGLGNGLSMIIMAGIISQLPDQFTTAIGELSNGTTEGYLKLGVYFGVMLIIVIAIVYMSISYRKIYVQYTSSSKRITQANNKSVYLPLKANPGGVIPVIFASSIMTAPLQLMYLFPKQDWFSTVDSWLGMETWYSVLIYALLIWFFTFFYAKLQIDPERTAEDLAKTRAYILNIHPGTETKNYINTTLSHLLVLGAIEITLIGVLPQLMKVIWPDLPSGMAISGTGLIIVTGVAIETVKQIKSMGTQYSYKRYYKKAKVSANA